MSQTIKPHRITLYNEISYMPLYSQSLTFCSQFGGVPYLKSEGFIG